ncbi:hypothetical protein, partial [Chengkuizengella marina]|uniref:hypothetical protein n=1 Tax=Chengkuizengella marina TaxID=2507566 RepID=UPI001B3545F4
LNSEKIKEATAFPPTPEGVGFQAEKYMNIKKIGIPTSIATIISKKFLSIKNKLKTKINIIIDIISGILL